MNLLDMRDRLLALPALENRLVLLESEIQEAEKDLAKLLNRYKQENRNVSRLEKEPFSALLLRLTGKLETRLEETKREEINAKLAYDNAATHLSNLTQEKQELASRIAPLKAEEKIFARELERRRTQITRQLNEPQGIRYAELENERTILIPQITKLKEALRVATNALSSAEKVTESLEKTVRARLNTSSIRLLDWHSHLDNAEQSLHVLSSQLRELKHELNGVHNLPLQNLYEMLNPPTNIEFVFNYLLQVQIQSKAQEISQILNILREIEATLTSTLHEQQGKYAANRREEEELLFSIS